jgi:hypothetical protein
VTSTALTSPTWPGVHPGDVDGLELDGLELDGLELRDVADRNPPNCPDAAPATV